ncbi:MULTISPECIES: cytochrome c peroxidase [unclassified Spirosoma]|uniref:cytochrome-c peroxidase n=1 Tax=unclassified Spirosoma TaxID=2621999 RepID=UPI0025D4E5DB|nr:MULTISPECIES: cytochrome c peroxidase [unclassified Spirosoma]
MAASLPQKRADMGDGQTIYNRFLADKVRFHEQVNRLAMHVQANAPVDSLRLAFEQSRLAYKRIEWLLEYYQPVLAGRVNGPPIVEVEDDDPAQTPIRPVGLQVIEPYLFPEYDPTQNDSLLYELNKLLTYSSRLEQGIPGDRITDSDCWEAVRQQLFRIQTLGITGYDAPEARTGIVEALASFQTLQAIILPYSRHLTKSMAAQLEGRWQMAIRMLQQAHDFTSFDRVSFIRNGLYPLCQVLQQARQSLGILPASSGRFLSPRVATLSDSGAFRTDYLINFGDFATTPQKVALGRTLFFDPLLSGNNARSCASCHQPERAFTDGRRKSRAFGSLMKRVKRNAPTLLNAGLQNVQFYDSRVTYLEDQAHDVLKNSDEMHSSSDEVAQKLGSSSAYRSWFAATFPTGLTGYNVRNALACYVRSLTSLNARPDRYLRGEPVTLSTDELTGFNLFMGKGRCATCHFFPIYNGFIPPHYEKTESEIIGVPQKASTRKAKLDTDPGKFSTYQKNIHRYAFKTPTIRNVALTAPYMHNGVYQTLEQVVDFYNRGGGRGIGIQLESQTLSGEPLHLSSGEQKALVAFMKALTDTTALTQRPARLPEIDGNKALNHRQIGGRY